MNKILIKYDEWSRMGNRMFPFALGYILSTIKKCPLYAEPLPNFPNTNNAVSKGEMSPLNNPIYTRKEYGNHSVNLDELIQTDRDIVIDSFVQRAEYYANFKTDLRILFNLILDENIQKPNPDTFVVHIRETDYSQLGLLLPEKYYLERLQNLKEQCNCKDITIVTDNCDSKLIKTLRDNGCNIHSTKYVDKFCVSNNDLIMKDFVFMCLSNNLFISQSSFSWWAAFLGTHDNIYVPVTAQRSAWLKNPNQSELDLYLPSFKKVDVDI